MNRVRTQNDQRIVEEADYKGCHVLVASGYNVADDNYLVHVYITPPSGPEIRVFDPPRSENSLEDALDLGFYSAKREIDQMFP